MRPEKTWRSFYDPADGKKPRTYRQRARKDYLKYTRCRKHTTKMTRKTLIRNFNNGIGITEMADQFRRSEPVVMQHIEKMDLYHRKDNPKRRRSIGKGRCLCGRCQLYITSGFTTCGEEQEGA